MTKRSALNTVIRRIGAGMAFASDGVVSQHIKDTWDELYYFYHITTGLDIKEEADRRGYESALDFVERAGCLDKLCEIAVKNYQRELRILLGKKFTNTLVTALVS